MGGEEGFSSSATGEAAGVEEVGCADDALGDVAGATFGDDLGDDDDDDDDDGDGADFGACDGAADGAWLAMATPMMATMKRVATRNTWRAIVYVLFVVLCSCKVKG